MNGPDTEPGRSSWSPIAGMRVQELKTWATPCSRSTAKYIGVRNSSFRTSTAYWPSRGRAEKKRSSRSANSGASDPAPAADRLELEDERPRMIREVTLVRLVHRLQEHLGVEEIGIHLARARRVLRLGEGLDRDLVPHLADAGEPRRQALRVGAQHLLRGRRVEAGVDPDGAEERKGGVLLQHPGRGALALVGRGDRPARASRDSSRRTPRSAPAEESVSPAPRARRARACATGGLTRARS